MVVVVVVFLLFFVILSLAYYLHYYHCFCWLLWFSLFFFSSYVFKIYVLHGMVIYLVVYLLCWINISNHVWKVSLIDRVFMRYAQPVRWPFTMIMSVYENPVPVVSPLPFHFPCILILPLYCYFLQNEHQKNSCEKEHHLPNLPNLHFHVWRSMWVFGRVINQNPSAPISCWLVTVVACFFSCHFLP